jgi:hypothetical protein
MTPVEISAIAGAVVTVASIIANFTETKKDDKIVGFLKKGLNFLAFNFSSKAGK